ncbi:MAG TPA: hypothetical protein VK864_15095 [Longimicrobiales bacterium]|nr:hypothetical protein [Longimicrobiales bacterium]
MMATALRWRLARWTREQPGKSGLVVMLVLPVVFLLPFERAGLFSSWLQAATVVLWLAALAVATIIGRTSGLSDGSIIWPYQKGVSPLDWIGAEWLLDGLLTAAVVTWWCVCALIAASVRGALELGDGLPLAVATLLIAAIAHGLLLLVGAAGSRRGADFVIVLSFLALMRDLIARFLPEVVAPALRLLMPPIPEAVQVGTLLGNRDPALIQPLLHVGAYFVICFALSYALLARRRPVL